MGASIRTLTLTPSRPLAIAKHRAVCDPFHCSFVQDWSGRYIVGRTRDGRQDRTNRTELQCAALRSRSRQRQPFVHARTSANENAHGGSSL